MKRKLSDLSEDELREELTRVKAIKEWLWLAIAGCALALCAIPLFW